MVDVAVIGRGMIGSAAARHLAEAGLTVAAIGPDEPTDWTTWTGPFASHFDEGRITRISDRSPVWSDLAKRSIERYPDIEARSGLAIHHPVGLAISTPDLDTWLDTSKANGAPVERVDPQWLADTTGITLEDDVPVAYEAAPAGHINPRRLVEAQNLLARQAGASIVAEAATSIGRSSVRPASGSSPGFTVGGPWGTIEAARVVVATGSFGHGLLDPDIERQLGLVRRPRTVLLAELGPDPDDRRHLPSLIMRDQTDDRLASIYWVPPVRYPNGRSYLKIGGVLATDIEIGTGSDPHAELVAWFAGSGDPVEVDALHKTLELRLPDRPILSTAAVPCVYTGTDNGRPFIDQVDDGLVVALGGNGAAAKSSDEIGRLAAALAAAGLANGGQSTDDETPDETLGHLPDPALFGLAAG
ncbi:MAG: FAD-binding oxidoreductase [Actinomycetota bacterium]